MNLSAAFIAANLIGISSNFDNCGIGVAFGSEKTKFPHRTNAIVNGIGFGMALIGARTGALVSHYLSPMDAAWTACIVLICIGLYFWYSAYVHPQFSKKKQNTKIHSPGWKDGIILGFALSLTNVASGFGAAVADASSVWITPVVIAIWGYLMIWLGNCIGIGCLSRFLGRYSSLFSGVLLILVGIHQVVI